MGVCQCKRSTLDDLVQQIQVELNGSNKSLTRIDELLKSYSGNDWWRYTHFDTSVKYTRNLVFGNKNFTLMILCWNPRQSSPCHDHSQSDCFMRILDGKLLETRYIPPSEGALVQSAENEMLEGQVYYINDSCGLHRVSNPTCENASSLHLYIPPYKSCKTWPTLGKPSICNVTFYSIDGKRV